VAVRRPLETVVKQTRSTHDHLERPPERSGVSVNRGKPFIDAESFPVLIETQRHDFVDAIDIGVYLS
jgi:hypothetical protein